MTLERICAIALAASLGGAALAQGSPDPASGQQPQAVPTAPPVAPLPPPREQPPPPPVQPPSSSQQVVVNPSDGRAGAPTTVIQTPPPREESPVVIREHFDVRSPTEIVATDAAYGGVAGLLVGGGFALINQGRNWRRDLMVGTGSGLLVGGAVGGIHAVYVATDQARHRGGRIARDGSGTPDRDPVPGPGTQALAFGGRF